VNGKTSATNCEKPDDYGVCHFALFKIFINMRRKREKGKRFFRQNYSGRFFADQWRATSLLEGSA
jgi:hypothetical protein